MSARKTIDLLASQITAQRTSPLRNGHMLHLPGSGDLVIAGDLHNHRRNFERVQHYADLKHKPKRMVILQELIHGGALGPKGEDTSLELLIDALKWSEQFPGQVHFILANHDLAQIQKVPIMKDGYDLTDRFNRYMQVNYGSSAEEVSAVFREFILSQALAAITVSGLMFTHSLPGPADLPGFDTKILGRALVEADLNRGGTAYKLVWGRRQNADVLAQLSKAWWAEAFVCGHQAQETGFATIEPNLLIIDSCHNHGVLLHVELAKPYGLGELRGAIVPLASIA